MHLDYLIKDTLIPKSIDIEERQTVVQSNYTVIIVYRVFFSTKTITVEFGCSKANQPKMSADPSAEIVFAHTWVSLGILGQGFH